MQPHKPSIEAAVPGLLMLGKCSSPWSRSQVSCSVGMTGHARPDDTLTGCMPVEQGCLANRENTHLRKHGERGACVQRGQHAQRRVRAGQRRRRGGRVRAAAAERCGRAQQQRGRAVQQQAQQLCARACQGRLRPTGARAWCTRTCSGQATARCQMLHDPACTSHVMRCGRGHSVTCVHSTSTRSDLGPTMLVRCPNHWKPATATSTSAPDGRPRRSGPRPPARGPALPQRSAATAGCAGPRRRAGGGGGRGGARLRPHEPRHARRQPAGAGRERVAAERAAQKY